MRMFGFLLPIVFFSACSGLPVDQDGGSLTRSQVEFISAKMRDATEAEFPLIKHKLVNRYVNNLGQSVISRNPDMPPLAYEFRVIRSNDILVFSLPGGVIYVSLGALRATTLEGQFVAALAHELAHQQLGHPLVMWRRKMNAPGGRRFLEFNGPWANDFLGQGGALWLEKGMEEEADRLAPVIMYRAGFDPRLYSSYLELQRKLTAAAAPSLAALASLHPPIAERIEWTKAGLLRIPPLKDANVSSATFEQIKSILQQTAKPGAKTQDMP